MGALPGVAARRDSSQSCQYVTAIIEVRAKRVIVVTLDGEIIHDGDFNLARTLR